MNVLVDAIVDVLHTVVLPAVLNVEEIVVVVVTCVRMSVQVVMELVNNTALGVQLVVLGNVTGLVRDTISRGEIAR